MRTSTGCCDCGLKCRPSHPTPAGWPGATDRSGWRPMVPLRSGGRHGKHRRGFGRDSAGGSEDGRNTGAVAVAGRRAERTGWNTTRSSRVTLWLTTLKSQTLTQVRISDWSIQRVFSLPYGRAHGVVRVADGVWVVHTSERSIVKLGRAIRELFWERSGSRRCNPSRTGFRATRTGFSIATRHRDGWRESIWTRNVTVDRFVKSRKFTLTDRMKSEVTSLRE